MSGGPVFVERLPEVLTAKRGRYGEHPSYADYVVVSGDGCWLWQGVTSSGYGRVLPPKGKRRALAHRLFYEILVGPIPDGLTLDHLCRNRVCVNPDHLEPTTLTENIRRGESPTAKNRRKTHCKWGHEFTEENTLAHAGRPGGRRCRTCERDASRERMRRKRAGGRG